MTMPSPKTRFFLCTLRSNLDNYAENAGFIIKRELDGPEIPSDLTCIGHYMVLEIVRHFQVEATTNYTTEEFQT